MTEQDLRPQIKVKTHRLYLDAILDTEVLKISDTSTLNYLKNVLRLKTNSLLRIFDKSENEYLLKINEIQNKYILLEKIETLSENKEVNPLDKPITKIAKNEFVAGICLLKPEKMREAVDVATQMGVSEIQPIISDRCQNFGINLDKIKTWAIEASEQSERLSIPIINSPLKLRDFVNANVNINDFSKNRNDKIVVANEHFGVNIKDIFKEKILSSEEKNFQTPNANQTPKFYGCIIGPEGGFSNEDLKLLNSDNIINVNLGSTILKSHVALAKILSFFCEN
jgi:16S rRNA (uracil1498-N3)-methyltransferase